jgi:aminoglycoside phosphotransferase (APT) family kinase protein
VSSKSTSCADLTQPAEVGDALCAYLRSQLKTGPLHLAEEPTPVPEGWEAHIYRFHVHADSGLSPAFDRPLALRAYDSPSAVPRVRHEFAVQRHLRELGYPVAEPLLLEERDHYFGGPFLIMEWIPGTNLLEHLRRHFHHVLRVAGLLAEMHQRLHMQPAAQFPSPPGPFLDRRLEELKTLIRTYGLDGLEPGLSWLRFNRPSAPRSASILHLDFHPVNLMVHEGKVAAVLDWGEADVGDRHADVAMSLVLLRSAPVEVHTLGEWVLSPAARWAVTRRYFRRYNGAWPLDPARLRYYLAWASLRRLAICGAWRTAGPQATGYKGCCLRYLETGHLEALQRCFEQATGLEVRA